jgi:hypothetical protein
MDFQAVDIRAISDADLDDVVGGTGHIIRPNPFFS